MGVMAWSPTQWYSSLCRQLTALGGCLSKSPFSLQLPFLYHTPLFFYIKHSKANEEKAPASIETERRVYDKPAQPPSDKDLLAPTPHVVPVSLRPVWTPAASRPGGPERLSLRQNAKLNLIPPRSSLFLLRDKGSCSTLPPNRPPAFAAGAAFARSPDRIGCMFGLSLLLLMLLVLTSQRNRVSRSPALAATVRRFPSPVFPRSR